MYAIYIILESRMKPLPDTLWIDTLYEDLQVVSPEGKLLVVGDHVIVHGEEEIINQWLESFGSFWVGEGPPLLQQFVKYVVKQ